MDGSKGLDLHSKAEGPKKRRNRVLLIGIDTYADWDNLEYPVSDCQQLFKLLKDHYGLHDNDLIQFLENEQATADVIYDELYRLQEVDDESGKPRLTADDNLIIVYSGHGHFDEKLRQGYWTPWNAPIPDPKRPSDLRNLVSVDEVSRLLSQLKAQHILLIIDACFPQAFTYENVDIPHEIRTDGRNSPEEVPSRWVMTAGRLEPVPDHSFFARALREELQTNQEHQLSIKVLDSRVRTRMEQETNGKWKPDCQLVVDSELRGGEFFFYRRTEARRIDHGPHPTASIGDLSERLRQGSAVHLDRLKKGRFKLLRIEKLLLTGANLPDFIDTQVKSGAEETPLHQAVNSLWGKEKPHAVVLGEGGMGKTVSLVHLWEDMLNGQPSSIPIFVALNEFNAVPESEKYDFVLRSIARNCGLAEALTDDLKNALWDFLKAPLPDGSPAVLLLLDGFNEVTVKKDQLLIDLNRLAEQAKGMQMVITSRYVEIQNFTWAQHSEVVELLPLPFDKIEAYLSDPKVNVPMPADEGLRKLFTNPMMLTLYAGSSSIARKYEGDKRFRFLPTGSYGELLWNFNEAQLAKHLEDCEHNLNEQVWHTFLLRCLVPALAYRMEEAGQFFIPTRKALDPVFNFKSILDEAFVALNREELTEVFPEFEGKRSLLGLGELADMDGREQRSLKVRQYLVEKLHLLVAEDEALRFVHQNFRDFFAACHLRNVAEMGLVKGELPEEWKVRAFSQDLRILIGEIEGEYKYRLNYSLPNKQWEVNEGSNQTLLYRVLERCRGIFIKEEIGFTIWNILLIWMILRWELTGIDLSRLWLKNINFNGIKLSGKHGKDYLTVNFANSILDGEQLCFKGNSEIPTCICDYPEKATILAGFANGEIKEFDLAIIKCINRTLHSEKCKILTIRPFEDEGFLSVGDDLKINFWSNEFDLIKTIQCQGEGVAKIACLSPNNAKLTIGFKDGKIQEIEILSGHPTGVNANLSKEIDKLSYDELGENIFIVTADRQVIKIECSTAVETVLIQFESIDFQPVEVSPDGKTVFSRNAGNGFIQWDLQTQAQIKSFERSYPIMGPNQLVFSPDNKKFIAPHYCGTYEEWDIGTGLLIRKIYNDSPRDVLACYRQDGKSLITAAHYGTIIETDLLQNRLLGFFKGTEIGVRNSSFFPNDEKLMIGLDNLEAQEWSLTFNKCIQIIDIHPIIGKNVSFEFGLNNPFILAGFWDFQQLIDLDSGRILTTTTANSFDSPVEEAVNIEFKALGFLDHYPVQYPLNFIKADYQEYLDDPASNQTSLYFVSHNLNKTKFSSNKFRKDLIIIWNNNQVEITIVKPEVGMKCQSVDFRHLHPSSHFTEEEKDRLRRYGAIFNDEDERRWKEAVEDA